MGSTSVFLRTLVEALQAQKRQVLECPYMDRSPGAKLWTEKIE
jgi:hypothetical protein